MIKRDKIFLAFSFLLVIFMTFYGLYSDSLIPNNIYLEEKKSMNIELSSEAVEMGWNRIWGGNNTEEMGAVCVDTQNNIYVSGTTDSYGNGMKDLFLLKYNSKGSLLWNITWGGSGNEGGAYGICNSYVDSNDSIYLISSTNSTGAGGDDVVLIKFDKDGNEIWNETWGGSNDDIGMNVILDSSNNIYITGSTFSYGVGNGDIVLIKYNSTVDYQWNQTWGGSGYDLGGGLVSDSLNNIYVGGSKNLTFWGSGEIACIKYNSSGVEQWNITWSGNPFATDVGGSIALDSLNNIYVGGYTYTYGARWILFKYNYSGALQWNKTWGGDAGADHLHNIIVDSSNNIYAIGMTQSFGHGAGDCDSELIKYSDSGEILWNMTWGGDQWEWGTDVELDSNNNIYISGWTESYGASGKNIFLLKYKFPSDNDGDEKIDDEELELIPGYFIQWTFILLLGYIGATILYLKYKKLN